MLYGAQPNAISIAGQFFVCFGLLVLIIRSFCVSQQIGIIGSLGAVLSCVIHQNRSTRNNGYRGCGQKLKFAQFTPTSAPSLAGRIFCMSLLTLTTFYIPSRRLILGNLQCNYPHSLCINGTIVIRAKGCSTKIRLYRGFAIITQNYIAQIFFLRRRQHNVHNEQCRMHTYMATISLSNDEEEREGRYVA